MSSYNFKAVYFNPPRPLGSRLNKNASQTSYRYNKITLVTQIFTHLLSCPTQNKQRRHARRSSSKVGPAVRGNDFVRRGKEQEQSIHTFLWMVMREDGKCEIESYIATIN